MQIKLDKDSLLWPVPRANETMLRKTPRTIVQCLLRLELAPQVVFASRTAIGRKPSPNSFYTRLISGVQLYWVLRDRELELRYRGSDSQGKIVRPAAILTAKEAKIFLEEVAAV